MNRTRKKYSNTQHIYPNKKERMERITRRDSVSVCAKKSIRMERKKKTHNTNSSSYIRCKNSYRFSIWTGTRELNIMCAHISRYAHSLSMLLLYFTSHTTLLCVYITIFSAYGMAYITNGKMIFCLSASTHSVQRGQAKRFHSSIHFCEMQVFVIRWPDDWLSDSWVYWWGNWFWRMIDSPRYKRLVCRIANRSLRKTMRRWFGSGESKRQCSDIKRAKNTSHRREQLWWYWRSEVIHIRNVYNCIRLLLLRVIYVYILFYWFLF